MTNKLQHILFITAITSFMAVIYLDQNGIGVTLTHIQSTFRISNTLLQWVMNSMLIATAVSVLIAGRLGDMFGTRKVFCFGQIGFLIASIICGMAPNITWLLIGRALQGLTASFMLTNYMVLIHHQYSKEQCPKILGLCISISAIFGAAAPAIAGILTQWLSWRGFFLINIPIILLCLTLTYSVINKVEGHASRENIDYVGMAMLVIAIAALVSVFTEASQFGWNNSSILITLFIGLLLMVGFYFFEMRHKNPLLHFEVLKNPHILACNIIVFCLQISLICTIYFAIWLQNVLGFSPFATGLAYLPQTLPVIIMATAGGHWASKKGFRQPIVFGLTLAAISIAILTAMFYKQSYAWLAPFLLLWSFGAATAYPSTISAMLSDVDTEHKGMVVGINQTCRSLACALGLAIFSTILVGHYGNHSFIVSTASKTAYTHAYMVAMLLPVCATFVAMFTAWKYIHSRQV
jgi:EmrB/QacA subfamily drug resistance transporter